MVKAEPLMTKVQVTEADEAAATDFADWHGLFDPEEQRQLAEAFAKHRHQGIADERERCLAHVGNLIGVANRAKSKPHLPSNTADGWQRVEDSLSDAYDAIHGGIPA